MKLLACCLALSAAACGSSANTGTTTTGQNGTSGSATGGAASGTAAASTTGSASASASGTATGTGTGTGTGTSAGTSSGTGGTAGLGSSCTVSSSGDPCVSRGLACSDQTGAQGSCQLPVVGEICLASVGCEDAGPSGPQPGCTPGYMTSTDPNVSVCLFSCATGEDCASATNSCQSNPTAGHEVCFSDDCNAPLTACDSSASGDGECFSFNQGQFAFCFQDGDAGVNGQCGTLRGGAEPFCQFGDFCLQGPDAGVCYALVYDDGGCPANNVPLSVASNFDWAVCAQSCTGLSDTSCPPLLACGALDHGFACLPQ